jgi:flagellar biosynthesis protein FliR
VSPTASETFPEAMLGQILQAEIFAVFLVFTRLGAAMMIMPGFGEIYVPTNIRLALAIAITLAVAPAIAPLMPAQPATPLELFLIVTGEIVIGLLIGSFARLAMTALHVSGTVIAFQSSLAFALTMDPTQGIQGALIASLFSLMGVVLIFATGMHHMLIRALYDSYVLFRPGEVPMTGDLAQLVTDVIADSFRIGIQMSAPFLVYGIVLYTGIGLLARLMPQLPFFFVIMPLQIWAAFFVLALTISGIMLFFMSYFEGQLSNLMVTN